MVNHRGVPAIAKLIVPFFALLADPFAPPPTPVDIEAITLADARHLDGEFVVVKFRIGLPPDWTVTKTMLGPAQTDDIERGVILAGKNSGPDVGDEATVVGVLRVRHFPQRLIGMETFEAFSTIRVESGLLSAFRSLR